MGSSLRLLVTTKCHRACEYCANEQYAQIPTISLSEAMTYDTVALTGGEPMLSPARTRNLVERLSKRSKVYLYTNKWNPSFFEYYHLLRGVTVTAHDITDYHVIRSYQEFCSSFALTSFRLALMPGAYLLESEADAEFWDIWKCAILDEHNYPEDHMAILENVT